MHPALHTWRDDLPAHFVRALAYVGGLAALSIIAAQLFQSSPPLTGEITAVHRSDWIEIEKPFPAFALSIPEASSEPAGYAIRRHADGNGRKDILSLGELDAATPLLQVEIYRPGTESLPPGEAAGAITDSAAALKPVAVTALPEPLQSKFGLLNLVSFETSTGTPRQCLGFLRVWGDPNLRLSGWFCQGGALMPRTTLACALDRLTLLAAGSEPRIGAVFAQAELNRSFCGQRDPLMAATPKYKSLWQASANRAEPRRR